MSTERRRRPRFYRLLATAVVAAATLGWLPARAHTLAELIDSGSFAICADPDALPFSSRAGNPPGLQIDLARIIADRLGLRLDTDWIVFRRSARRADCDALMSSVDRTDLARHTELPEPVVRQVLTRPYARLSTRIVIRDGEAVPASFADLRKSQVAVPPSSYLHYLLSTNHVPVRTFWLTDLDILDAVAKGEVPAGAVSDWNFGWYQKTHPNAHLRWVEGFVLDPDLDYNVAVTLRNTDRQLVAKVDGILGTFMQDGRIRGIFEAYGIPYRAPDSR